jgi:hypothetical protein
LASSSSNSGIFLEIGNQRRAVLGALVRLAEAVELQFDAVEAEVGPQAGAHQDHFGIDIRSGIPNASTPT